ncbi:two component regulator [Nitzschia inconspicua]|uniref:Two component regulator n=1 Tax=Nitzschia inconspicua TaxID=303405 RepID=A0A9K3PNJ7_9STRA|nr:two component regulator [Nitzschia inconspicua]
MTDQFSHYSFSSASQTSSSRKRPRRLRVKKYVEGFENSGGDRGVLVSRSIDMAGQISSVADDPEYHYDNNNVLDSLSRQSSISTHNSTSFHNGNSGAVNGSRQLHSESLFHSAKPNILGRIRHSLAAEEVMALQGPTQESAKKTRNTTSAPPARLLSDHSSSDGDEIIVSKHEQFGQTVDGAFPSRTNPIQEHMSQGSVASSEIRSIFINNTTSASLSSHSQQISVSDEASDSKDLASSIASSAATENARNTSHTLIQSQYPSLNTSITDSDEAWDRVVDAQSDVPDDDYHEVEHNIDVTVVPPSPIRPFTARTLSTEMSSTTRYEAYRATVERNFFRDEKPWAAITDAATSNIQVKAPPPRATPVSYARKEVPQKESHSLDEDDDVHSTQKDDTGQEMVKQHFAIELRGTNHPLKSSGGHCIMENSTTTSDGDNPSIYQDISFDQSSSSPQRSRDDDDDVGFPSTAAILQFARANTPMSSPGVSKGSCGEESDKGDDNVNSQSSSGEEYEIDIDGDVDHDEQQRNSPNWQLEENGEDDRGAAEGLMTATVSQTENLRDLPAPEVFQEQDTESHRILHVRSINDGYHAGTQQPRAKSLDYLSSEPSASRKSKRFQLWKDHGVYIRSSDSPSVSSRSSAATEPIPVVMIRRESIYDKNASAQWRKMLGSLFRWRYPEPEQTGDTERIESVLVRKGVDDEEQGVSKSLPLQMPDDDEEERKKRARLLAAAALFKKDDLHHHEETEKVVSQPDPHDPKSFHASLAAAAALLAAKRQQRMEGAEENYENSKCANADTETNVTQGSLAAQVAMLARNKSTTRSAEEFDKLYKKEPQKKEEPRLMVQLRPVKKDRSIKEKKTEDANDSAPALMVQLRPVSSRVEQQIEVPSEPKSVPSQAIPAKEPEPEVSNEKETRPSHTLGGFGVPGKRLEAYQAFSEPSSVVSSVTNVEPVYYKEQTTVSAGVSRHCVKFVVALSLMAAIALPVYFLVFADEKGAPSPFPTPTPSTMSPPQPTNILPSPVSPLPSQGPQPLPSEMPSVNISEPTPSPAQELENLLTSAWPPLEALFNNPESVSSPQVQAFDWMNSDANLDSYPDGQKLQRFAMATFFYSTGGSDWVENEGWLTEENECFWYSSSSRDACDDSGNLAYLDLNENGLSGSLPSELAMLSNSLTRIALSGNPLGDNGASRLGGSLPSEYGLLSKLEVLSMNNHRISGTIPSEIGLLTALNVLDLEGNEFSGSLPTTIGRLRGLNNFYSAFNRISGAIPSEVGQLSLLVNLHLLGNQLSATIPTEIGNLSILQSISLGSNRIQGTLPTQLGGLSNLQGSVDLSDNLLTGTIPTEMGQIQQIRNTLNLSFNKLSGSLPFELGRLVNLRGLKLQNNEFTGLVPVGFSSLLKLEELRIENNSLTGSVPLFVCQSLVTDKVFNNPTVFVSDCIAEVECSCCQYCCGDGVGCVCQFADTDNEFLCNSPALEGSRLSQVP